MVSHSRMGHASGESWTNKAEPVGGSRGLRQLHGFSAAALLRTHDLDGRGLSACCDEGFLTVPHSPDLVLSHLPFFFPWFFFLPFLFGLACSGWIPVLPGFLSPMLALLCLTGRGGCCLSNKCLFIAVRYFPRTTQSYQSNLKRAELRKRPTLSLIGKRNPAWLGTHPLFLSPKL